MEELKHTAIIDEHSMVSASVLGMMEQYVQQHFMAKIPISAGTEFLSFLLLEMIINYPLSKKDSILLWRQTKYQTFFFQRIFHSTWIPTIFRTWKRCNATYIS
jgi:hypothetical protein